MASNLELSEESDLEILSNAEVEFTEGESPELGSGGWQLSRMETSATGPEPSEPGTPDLIVGDEQSRVSNLYEPVQSQAPPLYEGEFSPEIRLLLLSPSTHSQSGLHGSLETFRLSDAPTYVALSYEWQGPRINLERSLDLQVHNCTLSLKPNLAHALECFRDHTTEPRYLWVDAVCINQASVKERGQQVQIMSEIYQHAHGVWIWLGPATHDSDLAMDVIDEVLKFPEDMKGENSRPIKWMKRVLYGSEYGSHRVALYSLFRRTYWKRLWIVQEVVLGAGTDAPMVCCGDRVSALGHIFKLAKGIRAVMRMVETSSMGNEMMSQKLNRAAEVVINLANHIDEHSEKIRSTREPELLSLLKRYNGNDCTDPRDKVYALLGIARHEGPSLQVEYSISLDEVCKRTAMHIIESLQSLDLLSLCLWQEEDKEMNASSNEEGCDPIQPKGSSLSAERIGQRQDIGSNTPEGTSDVSIRIQKHDSVMNGPSWVPKLGQKLGPPLYPATKIDPQVLDRQFRRSIRMPLRITNDGPIESAAIIYGLVLETIPIWIPGTPLSEQDHLQRLLQVLHRLQLSQTEDPDFYSPKMGLERTTAGVLYRILFQSESNRNQPAEHPHVDREGFIEWGACFLRGTPSSVQVLNTARQFVVQPQRTLFLYCIFDKSTSDGQKRKAIATHGYGLTMARARQRDEIVVLQSCKYVMLLRKIDHEGLHGPATRLYKVLGQCYASTFSDGFSPRASDLRISSSVDFFPSESSKTLMRKTHSEINNRILLR